MFCTTTELKELELQQLGIVKDLNQEKMIKNYRIKYDQENYIKDNTKMISLMIQFYQYIINEMEKDDYEDNIQINKKE